MTRRPFAVIEPVPPIGQDDAGPALLKGAVP